MGDFRMTRAMVVVLMVACSLVVIACGVATFLRYRKDDDDEDEDGEGARDGGDRTTAVAGVGGAVDATSTATMATATDAKAAATDEQRQLRRAAAQRNGKMAGDKEYHNTVVVSGRGTPIAVPPVPQPSAVTGIVADSCGSAAPSSNASPTSILRGGAPASLCGNPVAYAGKPPAKGSLSASGPDHHHHHHHLSQAQTGRAQPQQSYHRNPDIIPAPIMSPGGAVYNNYTGKRAFLSFFVCNG